MRPRSAFDLDGGADPHFVSKRCVVRAKFGEPWQLRVGIDGEQLVEQRTEALPSVTGTFMSWEATSSPKIGRAADNTTGGEKVFFAGAIALETAIS